MNEQARHEAAQVAAVAAAMLEDAYFGQANYRANPTQYNALCEQGDEVLNRIRAERIAQDDKWGPQTHHPAVWLAILVEEVGELADEIINADDFPKGEHGAALRVVAMRTAIAGEEARDVLEGFSLNGSG